MSRDNSARHRTRYRGAVVLKKAAGGGEAGRASGLEWGFDADPILPGGLYSTP